MGLGSGPGDGVVPETETQSAQSVATRWRTLAFGESFARQITFQSASVCSFPETSNCTQKTRSVSVSRGLTEQRLGAKRAVGCHGERCQPALTHKAAFLTPTMDTNDLGTTQPTKHWPPKRRDRSDQQIEYRDHLGPEEQDHAEWHRTKGLGGVKWSLRFASAHCCCGGVWGPGYRSTLDTE
jgi:hypothetical protein